MIKQPVYKTFEARLHHHFGHVPTKGQEHMFYAFSRMMFSDKARCALLIKGYAGTGKTTGVSAMVKCLSEWGINYVLLAPTGRAAKVLANYTGVNAWTIHRHIYMRLTDRNGASWFQLKENMLSNTVFFVDEASMIGRETVGNAADNTTGDLLEDLITHIYSGNNCKLVLIGDDAQLPPVGSALSPALQLEYLQREFDLNIAELLLDQVIRQSEGSGILTNATILRKQIVEQKAVYPRLKVDGLADVKLIAGDMQPDLEQAYNTYGHEGTIIITRSNKRANLFNQHVRTRVLYHEEEISQRDRMMVLKNNYFWLSDKVEPGAGFIANGDMIEIKGIKKFEDRESFRFCHATIQLIDYPEMAEFDTILLCNSIWNENASIGYEKLKELAAIIALDYPEIANPGQLKKAVYNDPYFNALQVKFAYAITCHKSQGGQWPCVFIDQGYLTDEMLGTELTRWFYTAITRAQQELFLVGFEEKMIMHDH